MIDIRKLIEDAKEQAKREAEETEGCDECGYAATSCQCFKPEDTGFALRVYRAGLPS